MAAQPPDAGLALGRLLLAELVEARRSAALRAMAQLADLSREIPDSLTWQEKRADLDATLAEIAALAGGEAVPQ